MATLHTDNAQTKLIVISLSKRGDYKFKYSFPTVCVCACVCNIKKQSGAAGEWEGGRRGVGRGGAGRGWGKGRV